jgi:dipeptidyl aminopeptidase/acylaminoacyl peptidase
MNASDDWTKVLYFRGSDVDPGSFYLVDRAKREFGIVGRCAAWIDSGQMAKVKPIEYPARDGLTIHGYLTLPPHCAGTNLPMIVKPHGGPGARDRWEFDPEVQFLANRGYAVLQMNFRGSIGYGLSFWRAGFKQWGGKMQDDLTDGVRWAISQGIADPSRIGIFGASYGGYAALTGLIKTPELFRCAISYVGVTDVRAITRRSYLEGQARKDFDRVVREEVGDYRADKKELEAISPTHLVDGIKVPVLLAYGGRDPIVPVEQGYTLAEALKKQHKKVELIVEKNEGHGFRTLAARTNLFHRIELFLAENLGN